MSSKSRLSLLALVSVGIVAIGSAGSFLLMNRGPDVTTTMTGQTWVTTRSATSSLVVTFRVFGKVFFDYNGNGKQENNEPPMANVTVSLDRVNTTVTNSTGWYVIDNIPRGQHSLKVYAPQNFRYMCESAAEFRRSDDNYILLVESDTGKDVGLMEGFLTLPLENDTRIRYNAFFDDDPTSSIKDWQGGTNTVNGHEGTDFGLPVGTPILAAAPGVVKYIDDWGPRGIFIIISHETHVGRMSTLYAHLMKSEVKVEQVVRRGERIGLSGDSNGPHLHFELDFGYHGSPTRGTSYTPVDVFRAVWDPNAICYWTKDNDPQFPR